MIEISSKIAQKYSVTYGSLWKTSGTFGIFRKMIGNVRMNFGQSSENLQKTSEIFRKLHKSSFFNNVVYVINRILHVRLWIRILSSRVQLVISQEFSFVPTLPLLSLFPLVS